MLLTLEWFIRYIYVSNVQLLNNVIITKTKVLLPQTGIRNICQHWLSCPHDPALWFTCSQILFNYLAFQSFDYEPTWWRLFQKHIVILNLIYICFYYCHWVYISADWVFVPEDIIRPVVSVLGLTEFIRYIYYWHLLFINNVAILYY